MASPGVWSYGSNAIPTGPIKVKHPEMNNNAWVPLQVNSANYAVNNLEFRVTSTGGVQYRYPTTNAPNGPKTTASSIQEIADDSLYVANYGYSTGTTTAIQSAVLSKLNQSAEAVGVNKAEGSQPPPTAPGAQGGTDPGAVGITTDSAENLGALTNVLDNFITTKDSFNGIKDFLYYPETISSSAQDKLVITQIEYVPGNLNAALTEGSLGNRESDFNQTAEKFIGQVILPIPNELSESNATAWGEDSLSSIAAAMMGGASAGLTNLMNSNFKASLEEFQRLMGKEGLMSPAVKQRLNTYLTANAAASVLKFGGIQVNPEAYITRATGAAVNPNLELLFQGPKLRQFGFQFKMSPRSAKEAKHIRSILKFFKKGMAPRRSQETSTSILLGTPNVFRINFKSGNSEIGSIGKIKTCALVSCNINYTPDGFYAAFNDPTTGSQPIAVNMQLGFTELTPIYNDEYDGDKPTVGPENIFENFEVKPAEEGDQ